MATRAMGGVGSGFSGSDLGEAWAELDGSGGLTYVGDANCETLSLFWPYLLHYLNENVRTST